MPDPVNDELQLPEPGMQVTGMTYESTEYNRGAYEISGILTTRPSPFDGPPQCWVDGVQVDPATIRALPRSDTEQGQQGTQADQGANPPIGDQEAL